MMSLNRRCKQANSLIRDIVNGTNIVNVQTYTVDNILNDISINNVSLISLTINGAELEAIEGMSKTLEIYSPRLSVAGWYLRNGQPIWKIIVPLLKDKGYRTVLGNRGRVLAWKDRDDANGT